MYVNANINTHIIVCIHKYNHKYVCTCKYEYSYGCMYTPI